MVWWRWSAGKTVEDMVLVSQRFIICHHCLHCRKVLARRCTGCVRSDRGFRCLVVFEKLLVRWQSFNGMAAWQLYANTHHRLPTLVWFTCALHYAQIFWQNRSKKKRKGRSRENSGSQTSESAFLHLYDIWRSQYESISLPITFYYFIILLFLLTSQFKSAGRECTTVSNFLKKQALVV